MSGSNLFPHLRLAFMALVVAASMLAGCAQPPGMTEGARMQVTDLAGREVMVKAPATRVVLQATGSGGGFITMLALEGKSVPQKIAGWDNGLKFNRFDMWEKYLAAMPELEKIPDVGGFEQNTFSVEKVIALKPDVVIVPLSSRKQAQDAVTKLETAGIPTVFIDYHAETVENHTRSITLVGRLIGQEKRAQELSAYYQEQVGKTYDRLKGINRPKPKVYVEAGSEGAATYGNSYGNAMWGALVEKCGGINIAAEKIKSWGPINPEYLLKTNPDVIIITGSYWPAKQESMRLGFMADRAGSQRLLQTFTKRTGWPELDAVKNKRVYSLHHGLARDIYDLVVMQYLAKKFYPEEFKDVDPLQSLQEFHRRFLPVELSGVWMIDLED